MHKRSDVFRGGMELCLLSGCRHIPARIDGTAAHMQTPSANCRYLQMHKRHNWARECAPRQAAAKNFTWRYCRSSPPLQGPFNGAAE